MAEELIHYVTRIRGLTRRPIKQHTLRDDSGGISAENVRTPVVAIGRWMSPRVIQGAEPDRQIETPGRKRKRRRVAALQKKTPIPIFHTFQYNGLDRCVD
jgi:hypothetical protein